MEINIVGLGMGRELLKRKPGDITYGLSRIIDFMDVDAVFDVHSIDGVAEADRADFFRRLEKCEKKRVIVYSIEQHDNPFSKRYPVEMMVHRFQTAYFSSSFDYAMAFALYTGATTINTYGINHHRKNGLEYHFQKPCGDFWVGYAMGMGVNVNIYGNQSELCKTRDHKLYGYNIKQTDMMAHVRSL